MARRKIEFTYEETVDYMALLESSMLDTKMKYNEVKAMPDYEGKAGALRHMKRVNDVWCARWAELNKRAGHASGCIEVFNATKAREINSLKC
jgi:hypothetical protein